MTLDLAYTYVYELVLLKLETMLYRPVQVIGMIVRLVVIAIILQDYSMDQRCYDSSISKLHQCVITIDEGSTSVASDADRSDSLPSFKHIFYTLNSLAL